MRSPDVEPIDGSMENRRSEIGEVVFTDMLTLLTGANTIYISELAKRCEEKYKSGQIGLTTSPDSFSFIPSHMLLEYDKQSYRYEAARLSVQPAIRFGMGEGIVENGSRLRPTIYIHSDGIKNGRADDAELSSDLLCALALADEAPDMRTIIESYRTPIFLVNGWLDEIGAGPVHFDPRARAMTIDRFIRVREGEARFFATCNFEQWKIEFSAHMQNARSNEDYYAFERMRDDKRLFFMTRLSQAEAVYYTHTDGPRALSRMSSHERQKYTATQLAAAAIESYTHPYPTARLDTY